ncbi:CDP-diacylglycerol--glycerol-3-phosphate 3-phosphatidyltransferase 2-like [Olea europaea subsp. europaea]|uniref:CDP-diacylglycerol--glycerol-3-phosphate 1-phosphatidyltransferase n=1 Tax=Olea europaea subsp. europaea TaxID=158383 RepID=A0A8S0V5A1_OLEEU|nr:CDP-diacylglycerol--glycerol-3-phosphate 3-phosphatidyltransferase 2-like [Olea europaea subsp. europaea]
MPGALKLTNLTSLYVHKSKFPHKSNHHRCRFLNTLSSSAAPTFTATILRSEHSTVCWWRITPCATLALRSKITPFPHPLVGAFSGRKNYFYTSESENKDQNRNLTGNYKNNKNNNLVTPMGATLEPTPSPTPKLLTLPTILTICRVAAVPLLISTFYIDSWWGSTATTAIFVSAAITDWLDGYLARKMKLGTPFGAFLDPVADKLMVAATLVLLCTKPLEAGIFGQAPWLLTVPAIAIIGREITMSAVREWAASQDKKLLEAVAVNNLGKWKTATQMTSLTIILAARDSSFVGMGSLVAFGVILLYISAWLAMWSLYVYMRKIWKVLLR